MERVAIIGCGAIASTHINAILNANKKIVGICDIVEEKALKLKDNFNLEAKIYTDYITMLNELNIDFIHICTPHYLHKEMVIEALKRNINVLCEKPLCISLSEIEDIKLQLENSKAQLGVCYQNRYNETTIKAKEICEEIHFTNAKASLNWKRDCNYYSNSLWRGKWSTEGGSLLINQSIHTIDLLCYLLGKPIELIAVCENVKHQNCIDTEDTAKVTFYSENSVYEFIGSNNADKDYPIEIELYNDTDKLTITPNSITLNENSKTHKMDELNFAKSVWGDGHKKLVKDFYECVEKSIPFSIGLEEGTISLKAVLTAYKSNGNKIKI